jgi:hypothetical protein
LPSAEKPGTRIPKHPKGNGVPLLTTQSIFQMHYLLVLTFLTLFGALNAQPLSSHQWKNRVLLVLAPDLESEAYFQQLAAWRKDPEGLLERKLIIYHVLPNQFALETPSDGEISPDWKTADFLYQKYATAENPFQVLLIGLDGTVKLQQNHLLSLEQLFSMIDGMPMRRRELKDEKGRG